MLPGLSSQINDVTADGVTDLHIGGRSSQLFEFTRLQNGHPQVLLQASLRSVASRHESGQFVLVFSSRVVHSDFYEKAILLGFREWVRALMLDGILCGEDDEDRR